MPSCWTHGYNTIKTFDKPYVFNKELLLTFVISDTSTTYEVAETYEGAEPRKRANDDGMSSSRWNIPRPRAVYPDIC